VAFPRFRYHPSTEAGLIALLRLGEEVFDELMKEIDTVKSTWEPEDKDDSQFIVLLRDYYLIFVVSKEDHSCLVLAVVEPPPRI